MSFIVNIRSEAKVLPAMTTNTTKNATWYPIPYPTDAKSRNKRFGTAMNECVNGIAYNTYLSADEPAEMSRINVRKRCGAALRSRSSCRVVRTEDDVCHPADIVDTAGVDMRTEPSIQRIINTYYSITALHSLATSIIWGINTLFLLDAGLDIFQVFLVNAAFTAGQVLFEVPTGVVADTLGRKTSFLLSVASLFVFTLLYVGTAEYGWGFWMFSLASVLLGLGFTFYTGAVDAWLVDALDHAGFVGTKESIFARGQMVFGSAVLLGTFSGGVLGQFDLSLPYYIRAVLLVPTFVFAFVIMRDVGFTPRPLQIARFGQETKRIFEAGVAYGWRHPVIKPLMFVSLIQGLFFIYGFYSTQRYFLDLLDKELVWVVGAVSALFGLTSIAGNALVGTVMRSSGGRRNPARVLGLLAVIGAALVGLVGLVGILSPTAARGIVPFAIAVGFYLLFGIVFGIAGPIRQGYINDHIPSEQRATVLSLDSFFLDVGGVLGQSGLGYLSRAATIPVAWVTSGVILLLGYPLYRQAERADAAFVGPSERTMGSETKTMEDESGGP